MNLPATGIPELAYRDGSLCYHTDAVSALAGRTGTPAFVFSGSRLKENGGLFQEAFKPPAPWKLTVAYSVKTAWEPKLLRVLSRMGAAAEVACAHELELALRAGFRPADVFLDGPANGGDVVLRAVDRGVRHVKIDSLDQLQSVAEAVGSARRLGVCLRIKAPAPRWIGRPAAYLDGRFGMGPRDLEEALTFIAGRPSLELKGLAVHAGSQVTAPGIYREAMAALASAFSLAAEHGAGCGAVNIGGGFPSTTLSPTSLPGLLQAWILGRTGRVPPLEAFGREVRRALLRERFPEGVRDLVVEPGRALVGNAAILLTRVMAVKNGWLVTDASYNFVPESLLFAARRFLPAEPRRGLPWKPVNISGSTLSGGDVLALGARLPPCKAGDILVMLDAGAYTLSRANRFTTLVPPAFLVDADGKLQTLRRKETAEDVVRESESW